MQLRIIGLIICDPRIERVLTDYSGKSAYNVTTSPYNGGYVDFVPPAAQIVDTDLRSPPRTCLFEDICFYLRNYSGVLNLHDTSSPRVIVEKVIASHFLKLAEYLQANIETVQWNLSRHNDLSNFLPATIESQWSDIQAWQRRIAEYIDDMQGIMTQLQIPLSCCGSTATTPAWIDCAVDYQFLHKRFTDISQRAQALNGTVSTLAGFSSSHVAQRAQELALDAAERSVREARSAKALTMLGILFIPFAYVSSLLSMAEPFTPGGDKFWVYFAITIPLSFSVHLGYFVLNLGYTNNKLKWSLSTFLRNLKRDWSLPGYG